MQLSEAVSDLNEVHHQLSFWSQKSLLILTLFVPERSKFRPFLICHALQKENVDCLHFIIVALFVRSSDFKNWDWMSLRQWKKCLDIIHFLAVNCCSTLMKLLWGTLFRKSRQVFENVPGFRTDNKVWTHNSKILSRFWDMGPPVYLHNRMKLFWFGGSMVYSLRSTVYPTGWFVQPWGVKDDFKTKWLLSSRLEVV